MSQKLNFEVLNVEIGLHCTSHSFCLSPSYLCSLHGAEKDSNKKVKIFPLIKLNFLYKIKEIRLELNERRIQAVIISGLFLIVKYSYGLMQLTIIIIIVGPFEIT